VDPETVRLKVGGDKHLRGFYPVEPAQGGDDLLGKKMGIDDQVRRLGGQQVNERPQTHFFQLYSERLPGIGGGRPWPVHQVVEEAKHRRGQVDQVQVDVAVAMSKRRGRHAQNIDVPDDRLRQHFVKGKLDSFRSAHVPGADGR
jgi:hypothetical protein